MRDAVGREILYLRLSMTRECGMRCLYCRPRNMRAGSGGAPLGPDDIRDLVAFLVEHHGLTKARLTGGEPTVRSDLPEIIRRLASIDGLRELAMTTNGLTLARDAGALADAGLTRVNISLDSLDPRTFERITGTPGLQRVLAGIEAAVAAGLTPVKLNTVVLRDVNDGELPELVRFASERGLEIRFIELMPMGPLADRWGDRFVSELRMRSRLADVVTAWRDRNRIRGDSARRYQAELVGGARAAVGFITPMSCPFCDRCDRIRVASDGTWYPCLMGPPAGSLLPALRPRFRGTTLDRLLQSGLKRKAVEPSSAGLVLMTDLGG